MKKLFIFLLLFTLIIGGGAYYLYSYDKKTISSEKNSNALPEANLNNQCLESIDFKKTEQILREMPIKNIKEKEGLKTVTFENGLEAVFMVHDVNTQIDMIRLYYFSQLLGLKIIPPTVRRSIDNQLGILQFSVISESISDDLYKVTQLNSKQKGYLYLIAFILGKVIYPGQLVIQKDCSSPVLIEEPIFSISFMKYKELPFALLTDNPRLETPSLSYKEFLFDSVKSIKDISLNNKQEVINIFGENRANIIFTFLKEHSLNKIDINYVKSGNDLFVRLDMMIKPIYEKMIPFSVPNQTIQKIKSLTEGDLEHIKQVMAYYFTIEELENFRFPIYRDFLERKDVFIENFTNDQL